MPTTRQLFEWQLLCRVAVFESGNVGLVVHRRLRPELTKRIVGWSSEALFEVGAVRRITNPALARKAALESVKERIRREVGFPWVTLAMIVAEIIIKILMAYWGKESRKWADATRT